MAQVPVTRRLPRLRRPRSRLEWIGVAILALAVFAGATTIWWLGRYTVAVHRLTRGVGDTMFYGADGKPWFRLDEQRRDVTLAHISPDLQHAVVAIEDRRFRYHLLIEVQLTKPQILELYLNRVYLSAGVYGVEAMSQHLYRKPAGTPTLAEAALIAGLIRAPSALSPWTNYEGALARSAVVLAKMREQELITAEQEAVARRVRPRIQPYRSPADTRAAWAKDYLRQQFRSEFGGDHPPDWRVRTSFQRSIQDAAERAVAAGVRNRGNLEAALVAIDPGTGDVLALVGGANYARSTFNRATRSRLQPGSASKPLVFAAALSNGYSPVSVLSNLDRVGAPEDPEWRPSSASSTGDDPTELTLRVALADSNNAAAAALQQLVGSRKVLQIASDAGLRDLPDVPSLSLGAGVVSPLDLTTAYTMFPGGGEIARPLGMLAVFDAEGAQVFEQAVERSRVGHDRGREAS